MTYKGIPGPKPLPILGNILSLRPKSVHKQLLEWSDEYGPIFQVFFFNKPYLVVSDATCIEKVMRERPKKFRRIALLQELINEIGGNGLFSAEGEDWKRQKRIMGRAFSEKQLINFFPKLVQLTKRFEANLLANKQNSKVVEIKNILSRYTIDVTTSFAFGFDGNAIENPDSDIEKNLSFLIHMVNQRGMIPWHYWKYFKLPIDRKLERIKAKMLGLIDGYIEKAKTQLKDEDSASTLLDTMILAGEDENCPFSHDELRGNVFTLLFAGMDTTSITLSWVLFFLATHRKYLEALRDELKNESASLDELDYTRIGQFKLLDAVIKESMRLHPVMPFLCLDSNVDTELDGIELAKGSTVLNLFIANYRDERYFKDPEAFKPERWLSLDEDTARRVFMPFGFGARMCPGRFLAFLEMKVFLINLIKSFDFELLTPREQVREVYDFTLAPSELKMKFSRK